jgi:hypothetical protein
MAHQMKTGGWERVRAPIRIMDSFFPPDSCTAFKPSRQGLWDSEIRWPDARRRALLRLHAPPTASPAAAAEPLPSGDQEWLV